MLQFLPRHDAGDSANSSFGWRSVLMSTSVDRSWDASKIRGGLSRYGASRLSRQQHADPVTDSGEIVLFERAHRRTDVERLIAGDVLQQPRRRLRAAEQRDHDGNRERDLYPDRHLRHQECA
jgi:hypothetical protein